MVPSKKVSMKPSLKIDTRINGVIKHQENKFNDTKMTDTSGFVIDENTSQMLMFPENNSVSDFGFNST